MTQLRSQRLQHHDDLWLHNPTTPDDGHSNHQQTEKKPSHPQPAQQPLMLVNSQKSGHLGLMNAQSPHKCWSILKSAVFGLCSALPPLVGGGGGLMCESVSKADLLSDHFDGKQSRESVDLPLTRHLSLSLTSFPFRSSEVRRLL